MNEFRGEINRKLQKATGELQATTARVAEAEQRISDIEEWDTAAREAQRSSEGGSHPGAREPRGTTG